MVPAVLFAPSLVDQRRVALAAPAGERPAHPRRAPVAAVVDLAERVASRLRPEAAPAGACATC